MDRPIAAAGVPQNGLTNPRAPRPPDPRRTREPDTGSRFGYQGMPLVVRPPVTLRGLYM